jgi:LPXTG-motif cell wall-anchored protein
VAVGYQALGGGTAARGSAGRWASALAPAFGGLLPLLICPQLTLNQTAGCQSPLDPIIRTILATTGDLSPWTMVAGLLLVAAGLAAFRRRTRRERGQQAAL